MGYPPCVCALGHQDPPPAAHGATGLGPAVITLNVRGLREKTNKVKTLYTSRYCDFLLLQETDCSNLHHNLDHIKLNWSGFKLHWDMILYMGQGNTHIDCQLSLVAKKTDTFRNTTSSPVLLLFLGQTRNISHLFQLAPQA